MIEDDVGCLTGDPLPSGLDWDTYWASAEQKYEQLLDEYDHSLLNPF